MLPGHVLCLMCGLLAHAEVPSAEIHAGRLRCEYQYTPLSVNSTKPRLSWICKANKKARRGLRQTAWRVLVSSSADLLDQDEGDLWDSGKVLSAETLQVEYAGKPLTSRQRCFWKVKIWDQEGRESDSSAPAEWTMGVLRPEQWNATWIASDGRRTGELAGCKWIRGDTAPESRFFRKEFELSLNRTKETIRSHPRSDSAELSAPLTIRATGSFVCYVNGQKILCGDNASRHHVADIVEQLVDGTNVVAIEVQPGNGMIAVAARLRIDTNGLYVREARRIYASSDGSWRVSPHSAEGWTQAAFDATSWPAAREIGPYGIEPWGDRLPLFRKDFSIDKPVTRALVRVCGLGHYELLLNGRKVGETVLGPGWTDYRRTCPYETFDITSEIRQGNNTFGIMLGNGMYRVTGGRYAKFLGSTGPLKVVLECDMEHPDGSRTMVRTDGTWKTTDGPILFSCVFGGEDYDARLDETGWSAPGFDDKAWHPAIVVQGPGGVLRAREDPPQKVICEYTPVSIREPKPGVYVYDLGQNFAGWPKIKVRGPAGSTVSLRMGELLDDDGCIYTGRYHRNTFFTYTLKGTGEENWSPRFTYWGFRYVQVEGAIPRDAVTSMPGVPRLLDLHGQFVHSAAQQVGHFSCSDELVNRIHQLILAAMRSNMQSVLTDCPHREKLAWLECTHLLGYSFMYNFDMARLYGKVARDVREAQSRYKSGFVPVIAPEYVRFRHDATEWGSASILLPWEVYQFYGDQQILQHYRSMRRYAEYLLRLRRNGVISNGLGDWLPPPGSNPTGRRITATAILYENLRALERVAHLLERPTDAEWAHRRAAEVREAFNHTELNRQTNVYGDNTTAANAMALEIGLVPNERRHTVMANLLREIDRQGRRMSTGEVGLPYLLRCLSNAGFGQYAYDIVRCEGHPGYAYQLARGATTLAETWDFLRTHSLNHCMLGHAEEFFYRGLGGIRPGPDSPGFKHFILRPDIPDGLAWVKARYDSIRGPITSEWKQDEKDGHFVWTVTIPPNTEATVHVPTSDASSVREGGRPAEQVEGVTFLYAENGHSVFKVDSGIYTFRSTLSHAAASGGIDDDAISP